jgi:hypothetical protein
MAGRPPKEPTETQEQTLSLTLDQIKALALGVEAVTRKHTGINPYEDYVLCRIMPITDTRTNPFDGKEFVWITGFEVNGFMQVENKKPKIIKIDPATAAEMNKQQFTKDASKWKGGGLQRYMPADTKIGDTIVLDKDKQISIDNPNHYTI